MVAQSTAMTLGIPNARYKPIALGISLLQTKNCVNTTQPVSELNNNAQEQALQILVNTDAALRPTGQRRNLKRDKMDFHHARLSRPRPYPSSHHPAVVCIRNLPDLFL
jgi:hypothetical protein